MKYAVTVVFLCVLGAGGARAQENDVKVSLYEIDSRPDIEISTGSNASGLDYTTNNNLTGGFEVQYKSFDFSLSPSLWGASRMDSALPATHFFDAKGAYYGRSWGFDGYYQYFRGFYAKQGPVVHEEPGMAWSSVDVNVYHSLTAASQVDRMVDGPDQNGAKWNFYTLFGFAQDKLGTGDSSLSALNDTGGTGATGLRRLETWDVFAAMGTTLNLYWRGFYLDPTLFVGYGPQYRAANIKMDRWGGDAKASVRFDMGFRASRFELGLSDHVEGNDAGIRNKQIKCSSNTARLYVSFSL